MSAMARPVTRMSQLKIDVKMLALKALPCFLLFLGMILASVEEVELDMSKTRPPKITVPPMFIGKKRPTPTSGYVIINSYVASYLSTAMTVIIMQVGNVLISLVGGIDKTGDAIWQAINAFIAFILGFMWCVVMQYWRTFQMPGFAFLAGIIFLAAAFVSVMPEKKVGNAAASRPQQPRAQSLVPSRKSFDV